MLYFKGQSIINFSTGGSGFFLCHQQCWTQPYKNKSNNKRPGGYTFTGPQEVCSLKNIPRMEIFWDVAWLKSLVTKVASPSSRFPSFFQGRCLEDTRWQTEREGDRDRKTERGMCPCVCLSIYPSSWRGTMKPDCSFLLHRNHKEQFKKQWKERNHIFIKDLLSAEGQSKWGWVSKIQKANVRERAGQISWWPSVHALLGHTEPMQRHPGPLVVTLGERVFAHTVSVSPVVQILSLPESSHAHTQPLGSGKVGTLQSWSRGNGCPGRNLGSRAPQGEPKSFGGQGPWRRHDQGAACSI